MKDDRAKPLRTARWRLRHRGGGGPLQRPSSEKPEDCQCKPQLKEWHTEKYKTRLPGLKFNRTLWVCAVSGGPYEYTAKSLHDAHVDLHITAEVSSFELKEESRIPESLEAIVARYRETYVEELQWISHFAEADLDNQLESPFIPGGRCSVAESVVQVCMHSHGYTSAIASVIGSSFQ